MNISTLRDRDGNTVHVVLSKVAFWKIGASEDGYFSLFVQMVDDSNIYVTGQDITEINKFTIHMQYYLGEIE